MREEHYNNTPNEHISKSVAQHGHNCRRCHEKDGLDGGLCLSSAGSGMYPSKNTTIVVVLCSPCAIGLTSIFRYPLPSSCVQLPQFVCRYYDTDCLVM
jgi:hypothetical protein